MPAATFSLCGRHVLFFIPAVLGTSKPARPLPSSDLPIYGIELPTRISHILSKSPLPLTAVSQYLWQQGNEVDEFI